MMPLFSVEQYELYVQELQVEASDEAEAVAKVLQGQGKMTAMEFVSHPEDYGMSLHEAPELASRLFERGILKDGDAVVPSIRSVSLYNERES
jgi:hypothetical protein